MKVKQSHVKSRLVNAAATKRPQRYRELKKERDLLQQEIVKLKAERDQYLKALYALTREPLEFDEKTILSQVGKRPSLRELIAGLESSEA